MLKFFFLFFFFVGTLLSFLMLIFVKSKVTDGFCAMSRVVAMLKTIGEKEDFPSVYWGYLDVA